MLKYFFHSVNNNIYLSVDEVFKIMCRLKTVNMTGLHFVYLLKQ